jgi:uncharacterized protein (TIGR04255 family)
VTAPPKGRAVDFEHPPLNEVVFSVQFDGDVIDEVGVLAHFWPLISSDFPEHDKHPPLPPASESFEVPPPSPELQLRLMQGIPPQRYWFLSEDQTLIVQVQADRLMLNWRRVVGNEPYPHYDTLSPRFSELLTKFFSCEAVDDSATVDWVELQYVNPVEMGAGEQTHGQLARILNFLVADPPRTALPPVEDTQIQQRFRILGDNGEPLGRLYLTAVPAFTRQGATPAYVITLLARGRPVRVEHAPDGVQAFLDKAHELIVNGFAEVTTAEMHETWRAT